MSLSSAIRMLVQRNRLVTGSRTANWNSGVATSGNAGADLVTVGAANRWMRLTEAYLVLAPFNVAANILIRNYSTVGGVEIDLTFGGITWWPATDPVAPMLWWFWSGSQEIFGTYRFEVSSDQAADDGVVATYEYRVKDW